MDFSARKNTYTFRFMSANISSLDVLCSRVLSLKENMFRANFGNIIDILTEKVNYGAIITLA